MNDRAMRMKRLAVVFTMSWLLLTVCVAGLTGWLYGRETACESFGGVTNGLECVNLTEVEVCVGGKPAFEPAEGFNFDVGDQVG